MYTLNGRLKRQDLIWGPSVLLESKRSYFCGLRRSVSEQDHLSLWYKAQEYKYVWPFLYSQFDFVAIPCLNVRIELLNKEGWNE
jgi:hypothetical protein